MILLQALSLGLVSALTPGPMQTFLIAESLRRGWRGAMIIAFAPLLADGPIIVLTLVVLDRLPALFLPAVRLAGGFFLLFLALGLFRSARATLPASSARPEMPARGTLARAIFVIWLAPAPYLFWTTVLGPLLVASWRESRLVALLFLAAFYSGMVGTSLLLVALVSRGRALVPAAQRPLLLACAAILALLGLSLLWSGLGALGVLW